MEEKQKQTYEQIICRIDGKLSKAKYGLVGHIPGDGLKGVRSGFYSVP